MSTLKFTVSINAVKEKVWEKLWNDDTYRQWTAAFQEGSYAESNWEEGSEVLFLVPGGNGMFSVIDKKIPNVQMSFRHLGEISNGIRQIKDWGVVATENYYLHENTGVTRVDVETATAPDFEVYLKTRFPVALGKLKQLCEL